MRGSSDATTVCLQHLQRDLPPSVIETFGDLPVDEIGASANAGGESSP